MLTIVWIVQSWQLLCAIGSILTIIVYKWFSFDNYCVWMVQSWQYLCLNGPVLTMIVSATPPGMSSQCGEPPAEASINQKLLRPCGNNAVKNSHSPVIAVRRVTRRGLTEHINVSDSWEVVITVYVSGVYFYICNCRHNNCTCDTESDC